MSTGHGTRTEQKNKKSKRAAHFSPDRLSLSKISGTWDRTRPIDLSRATSHARHVTHVEITARGTGQSVSFPVGGQQAVLHPQPPMYIYIYIYGIPQGAARCGMVLKHMIPKGSVPVCTVR